MAGDVDALHRVHADPLVMRYYDAEVGTREHAERLVTMFVEWAADNPRRNVQLAIVESDSSRLVGSCGVRTSGCPPGEAELGIGIGSEWWGRGVKTIRAVTVAENEGVTKFAARLGFIAGTLRRGDDWMISRGWSARNWSMTREDWEKSCSAG